MVVTGERAMAEASLLISLLEQIQETKGYLPEEDLMEVSKRLGMSIIDVYGVATFYKSFSLKPKGRHKITACLGTACHVRGAVRVANEIERRLGIKAGETTTDHNFSFEVVNCLGCCAIGPLVVVDGKYYGEMTTAKTLSILRQFTK